METKKQSYEAPSVIFSIIGSDVVLASDPWEDWGELIPFSADW